MHRLRGLALVVAVIAAACAPASADGTEAPAIRVAAAADLRFAMDELLAAWAGAHPDVPARAVYGSSGTFFAQISQGAPFDVFFSADAAYPRSLEEAGLAEPGATRLYATGQVVTWVPASSALDVERRGLEALTDPAARKVAIANPEHAPYGRAAVAAMESAGVYEAVEPKLVLGENVSQAAQFVESGGADAGVIALSLAMAPTLRDLGRYAIVPIDSYPRLEQGAVVLDGATDPAAASDFLDFVLGPDGRAVLDRFGFLLPPP
jgi:molybdate transport system substrate-binding protein